jgi:tRNA(Ile)-lysidine synthase
MDRAPPARTAVGTAAHPSADAAVLSGPDLRSVRAECARSMDARLRTDTPAPLAVALSGGGDSVALLALAAQWARRHDRRVLALTVDHGLQPESAAWSQYAADTARRSGAEHRVLPWLGDKPTAGLSAAARRARHALLAQAAREAGASVILMGHTADDRLEGDQMRAQGTPLGELRVWSPSPVWPEGAASSSSARCWTCVGRRSGAGWSNRG